MRHTKNTGFVPCPRKGRCKKKIRVFEQIVGSGYFSLKFAFVQIRKNTEGGTTKKHGDPYSCRDLPALT